VPTDFDAALLDALPVTHRATIPESYLDDMGHMNVMWYTHLFDRAVVAFFASFGLHRAYFDANQAGTFALEKHTRYLAEVRLGANVAVRTRALGRSAKRLHFMHFLVNEDKNVLSCTSEVVGSHIDMRVRRSSPLPEPIARAYDSLLAAHAALPWAAPVCGVMKP
jgi:acyl-CoA thioester hydrolase